VAVAACAAYGRCSQTVALLTVLKQLPRVWELAIEQDQNRARFEEDLVLDDELAELEDAPDLATELSIMMPFVHDAADEEVVKKQQSWQLKTIPDALARELAAFAKYRQVVSANQNRTQTRTRTRTGT
jgi:hypothetical protein